MKELFLEYKKKKKRIKRRLKEFRNLHNGKDEDIFAELCFCLLTPQSKAIYCDKAVKNLKRKGLLLKGSKSAVKLELKGVRFANNKTTYLFAARKFFKKNQKIEIKNRLCTDNIPKTRQWLVENVKGIGYKEASHFLRNIGLGEDIAILDTHILRNLKRYGVIEEVPISVTKKTYFDIEGKMRVFSRKIKIPLEELDILFWSNETGLIFK